MANEAKKGQKLPYNELEQVASNLQRRVNELEYAAQRTNDIRDAAYLCIQMLEHKDVLPDDTIIKIVKFLDRLIPVAKDEPKDQTEQE